MKVGGSKHIPVGPSKILLPPRNKRNSIFNPVGERTYRNQNYNGFNAFTQELQRRRAPVRDF